MRSWLLLSLLISLLYLSKNVLFRVTLLQKKIQANADRYFSPIMSVRLHIQATVCEAGNGLCRNKRVRCLCGGQHYLVVAVVKGSSIQPGHASGSVSAAGGDVLSSDMSFFSSTLPAALSGIAGNDAGLEGASSQPAAAVSDNFCASSEINGNDLGVSGRSAIKANNYI